jgi:hypothetical protein
VLAYNMRVPAAVRRAIAGWSTEAAPTIEALRRLRVPVLITHGRRDTGRAACHGDMTKSAIRTRPRVVVRRVRPLPVRRGRYAIQHELLAFVGQCRPVEAHRARRP